MARGTEKATAGAERLIGGRYRLGERIGRGGMASVYRAHDEQLDRAVAVKVMRADLGEGPLFFQRFAAEARRSASVSHPNVVPVYDIGVDDGAPYIVMELVAGGDLAKLLAAEGRMPAVRAVGLAADVAAALQAAHDAGLVHRDVKPGNILLRPDGRAMVADFGIARATGEESMTKTGSMLGSVEYFSPEQARGERATAASDIYALGVVLYELLTGKRPFHGDTPYAVATARLRGAVPDPRAIVAELPPDLAGIVAHAMARDAGDRYESADAMRVALLAWLEGAVQPPVATKLPAAAAPLTTTASDTAVASAPMHTSAASQGVVAKRKQRPERRRVAVWPLALFLVAMVGGGFVGATWLLDRDGDRTPGVVVGSPGGAVIPNPTPLPDPATPVETTATPSESPTPAPAPRRATVPAPDITDPPLPSESVAPVAVATPEDSVAAFYSDVEAGRFDDAYALWSDRMKATYPREGNLDSRFDETAGITFSQLSLAEQSGDSATVQANFTETYDSGASREFIGFWRLVLVGGRWLLDEPHY